MVGVAVHSPELRTRQREQKQQKHYETRRILFLHPPQTLNFIIFSLCFIIYPFHLIYSSFEAGLKENAQSQAAQMLDSIKQTALEKDAIIMDKSESSQLANCKPGNGEWSQLDTTHTANGQRFDKDSISPIDEDNPERPMQTTSTTMTNNSHDQAKLHEESTKQALSLRKKELKWKLMQASQSSNRAKLEEARSATAYHRLKLTKAQNLAAKLRSKYVKVVKSAKLSELQLKKAEQQLALLEKHVAEDKMQLTRLAIDCTQTGTKLFGPNYKLPESRNKVCSAVPDDVPRPRSSNYFHKHPDIDTNSKPTQNQQQARSSKEELMDSLAPFLRTARAMATDKLMAESATSEPMKGGDVINNQKPSKCDSVPSLAIKLNRRKPPKITRLSSMYDSNLSLLNNIASYRLTRKFADTGTKHLTDTTYSHNISPLEFVCLPDLLSECSDKSCPYQHKSNYLMTDLEKLTDILSYRPSMAGYKPDEDLSSEENQKMCRVILKRYAAQLISKNVNKSVEMIARDLVDNQLQVGEPDMNLILMTRQLPKSVHLNNPPPSRCPCDSTMSSKADEMATESPPAVTSDIIQEPPATSHQDEPLVVPMDL